MSTLNFEDLARDMKLLDRVKTPVELRGLPRGELARLAAEVRAEILTAVCETGGHLASSLGVVELTIAIHYIFNTPHDRVIWDVGHQCYPHKILTGRRDRFPTIRTRDGLSGFPKRSESEYDAFGTGHASTSISAAMGMAKAFQLAGKPDRVVAVIGDGGLTGGMALEALNQHDEQLSNLTLVLNDNEMSIAPSVGALSTFLSRSVAHRRAFDLARLLRRLMRPLPEWLIRELQDFGRRWRQSFLTMWTPGALVESLGYHYIGPVDGHRFEQLLPALQQAREAEESCLVHVLTQKGKGYPLAEQRPCDFHGVGPFDLATGANLRGGGPPSYTDVFARALARIMADDPQVVAITAAMAQGTGLDGVAESFPARVFDLGITEPHCVTFAAGLACEGFRPVVAIYSTFLQRAYDQVLHDVCLQNLPVIFCLDRAGIVGEDGPTHHGLFDLSFLRSMPNLAILAPADENELQHLLYTMTRRSEGPAAIRYPRGRGVGVVLDPQLRELAWGKAELRRPGRDLVIVAAGPLVAAAEEAAARLADGGVEAAVINARFVKPLDRELILAWAGKTGAVVTVEENNLPGGFGAAVLEAIDEAGLEGVLTHRIGLADAFLDHGSPAQLRAEAGLDPAGIASACRELLAGRKSVEKKVRAGRN
jgi:1-deoxy-D-xylulose-5-phosphate synthase